MTDQEWAMFWIGFILGFMASWFLLIQILRAKHLRENKHLIDKC
jgi:hypothetical protein